jgi:threonine/homoserine efflux transporter RhtA
MWMIIAPWAKVMGVACCGRDSYRNNCGEGSLIVGVILLRIVFELAETVIKIGCLVLFVAGIGWLLYMIFGGG